MRIQTSMPLIYAQKANLNHKQVEKTGKINFETLKNNPITLIAFTGSEEYHDINHVVSTSVEDAGIGLSMYKSGGQGVVAYQLPEALQKAGMRVLRTVPYISYNNPNGWIKVLVIPKEYDLNNLPDKMPENLFVTYPIDKPLEEIAKNLNMPVERVKFVVQDAPETVIDPATKKAKPLKASPYRILIPTKVAGSIQRIDENTLGNLCSIPYKAYKMVIPHKGADGKTIYCDDEVICVHSGEYAKFEKVYTYNQGLKDHPNLNLYSRDFCEASMDMLPQLNSEEFNSFKPANVIGHCRTGFPITEAIINRSQAHEFFRGMNSIDIFHNCMERYQGITYNPLDFLRYKATGDDWLKLTQLPEFSKLLEIDSHRYNLSEEETKIVDDIIRPFLQYYVDDNGNYNHSITPLRARELNPQNVFPNHVSHTFANEVIIYDDIARGLTGFFRKASNRGDKIPGRPNGCNIDFMRLNDSTANMGNNGLSKDLSWYHPYDPKTDSAEKIVEAKRANTKGFLNAIGKATKKRLDKLQNFTNTSVDDALNRLFFSTDQIKKNKYVLGGLSAFNPKDILWGSWGRSDAQKGYPILLRAFEKYLGDESVPLDIRLHSKLIIGSGSDPWPIDDKGAGDFHEIKETMYRIQTMNEGRFAQNVMYSNGGISNRLASCMTYTMFTSTGEPQGLTVPESLQTGTPAGSVNSGGAGEMIVTAEENPEKANGFKTQHAYMQNLKDLEEQRGVKIKGEEIGKYRLDASSDEIAQLFKDMALTYHNEPETYKHLVHNASRSEFDWHNNQAINSGRSTLQLYMEDGFKVQEGLEGRNSNPLRRLVGIFGGKIEEIVIPVEKPTVKNTDETVSKVVQETKQSAQKIGNSNKWTKIIIGASIGIVTIGSAAYLYLKNKNNKTANQTQFNKVA